MYHSTIGSLLHPRCIIFMLRRFISFSALSTDPRSGGREKKGKSKKIVSGMVEETPETSGSRQVTGVVANYPSFLSMTRDGGEIKRACLVEPY
ncbi:hypothetical protein CVT25_007171 [Psilocybe cyanescens]|uniref:Uncharacterized protein n=1 Tax=Psilocybe cyanescens TaxID=93625 RepID=A0A409WVR3_PSICY|nr:hypothetical protein CVT25_007171 [Psilocybe cyanescens]